MQILDKCVRRLQHGLEGRAFRKWHSLWEAEQTAIERNLTKRFDTSQLNIYMRVLKRMGFYDGQFIGRAQVRALNTWKNHYMHAKAENAKEQAEEMARELERERADKLA